MRTITTETQTKQDPKPTSSLRTFSGTLVDGREITIREMTGRDLIYMEEKLSEYGDSRKSFYMIERLNIGDEKVSFDEIADLSIRDIKTISSLIEKANGSDDEQKEEETAPN